MTSYTSGMAKIQRLTANCYLATDLCDGDILPVGGSNTNDTISFKIRADFAELQHLFVIAEHTFAANDMNSLKQFAESTGTRANPEIFASLILLQKFIEGALWPKSSQNPYHRYQIYKSEAETPLSKLVVQAQMACVEFSLFAGKFLQDRGAKVKLITGAFVDRKIGPDDHTYNEKHTYLAIDDNATGQVMIYDPANPASFKGGGQCPSVFVVEGGTFARWLKKVETTTSYLEVTEELTGNTKYYGVGFANSGFNPERDIFKDNAPYVAQHAEALPKREPSQIKSI